MTTQNFDTLLYTFLDSGSKLLFAYIKTFTPDSVKNQLSVSTLKAPLIKMPIVESIEISSMEPSTELRVISREEYESNRDVYISRYDMIELFDLTAIQVNAKIYVTLKNKLWPVGKIKPLGSGRYSFFYDLTETIKQFSNLGYPPVVYFSAENSGKSGAIIVAPNKEDK